LFHLIITIDIMLPQRQLCITVQLLVGGLSHSARSASLVTAMLLPVAD